LGHGTGLGDVSAMDFAAAKPEGMMGIIVSASAPLPMDVDAPGPKSPPPVFETRAQKVLATAGTIHLNAARPKSSATTPTPGNMSAEELFPGSTLETSGSAGK
jgi:hypothetical protein